MARGEQGGGKMETKRERATECFTLPVAPYIVPYLSGFGDPIGKAL